MGNPYVGEIRMFAGNFPPAGWMFCQGQLLNISEFETLYAVVGTTYGGDGQTTFALPDLRSRVPIHQGQGPGLPNFTIGQPGGAETVTLIAPQMPAHNHVPQASSSPGTAPKPSGGFWAAQATLSPYSTGAPSIKMDPQALGLAGGSQPHDNMIPFLAINFIISLSGLFPSQ